MLNSFVSRSAVILLPLSDVDEFKDNVSISGHVFNEGIKPYRNGMKVIDLIFLGGGFENEKHLADTYLEKAQLFRFNDDRSQIISTDFALDSVLAGIGIANKELEMGGEIKIYSKNDIFGDKTNLVSVEGFVKRPGSYRFFKDMKISDLLFMAGGFSDSLHYNSMFLERADPHLP